MPPTTPSPQPQAGIETPAPASDGERRQLTVLFADIVGATPLSTTLDPEALRALLRAYQQVCGDCIDRYGGTLHQYAGDGVLAYFGFPVAHDNDAERAVRAGLDIAAGVQRMAGAAQLAGGTEIAVRIGVHTGLVVVGEMGAGSALEVHAIGETPNVAARVQGEAPANAVCISEATRRLLRQGFELRSIGVRALKGVPQAMELFAVEAARAAAEPAPRSLIGRDKETSHLRERWALARRGQGQAVLVSGEGGLGKSSLLAAFRALDGDVAQSWRSVQCSPFYQNSALHPIIELIERVLQRAGASTTNERAAALKRRLAAAGLADAETFGLIAGLLGLEHGGAAEIDKLAPDQRKRRTLDALIAWLEADAQQGALVLVVEDLHWIDPSTRDLIGMLLERVADMPMLMLLTYRPEFVPSWAMHGHVSTLPLARLSAAQSAQLASIVSGGLSLPIEIVDALVKRTDGIPLFVEELTKAVLDSRALPGDAAQASPLPTRSVLEVPATLRDSLTARLDRLGAAKSVAQLASVLGREFDYADLRAICDLSPAELEDKLAALNRADIVQQRGVPPRSHYVFKHALIQEAAYDTLLKSTRSAVHRRVAEAYVQQFPQLVQARPELLAFHYSRALMPAESLQHWQRAGEVAVSRSGYAEAMAHLGAALEQMALLPPSPQLLRTELELRVKVGPALIALKGFAAAEVRANYERACAISEDLGDSAERFSALWGDWANKTLSGRVHEAARRSEDLVVLSRRLGQEEYVLQAHHSRWTNLLVIGDAQQARADALVGIGIYDHERHRSHRHLYGGHDPGVCGCGAGAYAAWLTGHADEASRLAAQAVVLGEAIEHPFSESIAWFFAMKPAWLAGDYSLARERAESGLQVSDKHGFVQWIGTGMVYAGSCRTLQGEQEFGLKLIEEGVSRHKQNGPLAWTGDMLAAAATALLHAGNVGRANELLLEARDVSDKTGAAVMQPEVLRLQAEVLLQSGTRDVAAAKDCLQSALALARRQGALALEWRCAMSLARLQAAAGDPAAARALLSGVQAGFKEGMGSPEVVQGLQWLDEIGADAR